MFNFNTSFWRTLTNLWTLVFFAAIIYDFITENSLTENHVILGIAAIYGASLAIYSAEKEFKRWHHIYEGRHPGEVYTILWTILIIGIIIANTYMHKDYHLPPEVSASYVVILGILAITQESKNLYKKRKKRK